MVAFLDMNGYRLTCSEEEETVMVLRAAASEMAEEKWTAWGWRSVAPA
jgi:death-on-curing protein